MHRQRIKKQAKEKENNMKTHPSKNILKLPLLVTTLCTARRASFLFFFVFSISFLTKRGKLRNEPYTPCFWLILLLQQQISPCSLIRVPKRTNQRKKRKRKIIGLPSRHYLAIVAASSTTYYTTTYNLHRIPVGNSQQQ